MTRPCPEGGRGIVLPGLGFIQWRVIRQVVANGMQIKAVHVTALDRGAQRPVSATAAASGLITSTPSRKA